MSKEIEKAVDRLVEQLPSDRWHSYEDDAGPPDEEHDDVKMWLDGNIEYLDTDGQPHGIFVADGYVEFIGPDGRVEKQMEMSGGSPTRAVHSFLSNDVDVTSDTDEKINLVLLRFAHEQSQGARWV